MTVPRKTSLLHFVSDHFIFYIDGRLWHRRGDHVGPGIDRRRMIEGAVAGRGERTVKKQEGAAESAFTTWPAPRGRMNSLRVTSTEVLMSYGGDGKTIRVPFDEPVWRVGDVAWMNTEPRLSKQKLKPYREPRPESYDIWRTEMPHGQSWPVFDSQVVSAFTSASSVYDGDEEFADIFTYYNTGETHVEPDAAAARKKTIWLLSPTWAFSTKQAALDELSWLKPREQWVAGNRIDF